MTEVLVLVTVDGGRVTRSALELLTLARRIGEPSAVVFGSDVDTDVLSRHGAATVYTFESPDFADFLVVPKAEALAALVADAGINGFYFSKAARTDCCFVRKVAPLNRALAGASAEKWDEAG